MEELELTPISSMFEENHPEGTETVNSLFADFDEVEETEQEEKEEESTKEEKEVEEETEGNTEDTEAEEDLESVKTLYNYWKEFLPFDETEEPTVEFLREQQEKLPEKFFLNYVDTRSEATKALLEYDSKLENTTLEDLKNFFEKYVDKPQVDVDTTEGAREYLKNRPELKKLYKNEDKIQQVLDEWEDGDELINRAKEFKEEEDLAKEEARKQALAKAEADKQEKIKKDKEFASNVNKTIDELQWKPERKLKVISEINPQNIAKKWDVISKNPKALVQFADFLSYFEDGTFDKFYKLIEGKEQSKETKNLKGIIEKDSLGKLLSKQKSHESKGYRSLEEDFG